MNLNFFDKEKNLFDATRLFFKELNIPLKTITKDAQTIESVINKNFEIVNSVYTNYIDNHSFESLGQIWTSSKYKGLLVFSLDLKKTPKRKDIADLTRAFNQKSKGMPVCLLLKYGNKISLALSERANYKQEWRDGEKVGKVVILRDIDTQKTHAGHLRILDALANHGVTDFSELHAAWLKTLNIKTLNTDFYKRLVKWYELCLDDIQINLTAASKILGKKIDDELKPQAVIRVIIRLMFMWFMKEKHLIGNEIFTRDFAKKFLNDKNKDSYYNAILQNLFFAVLNRKIDERRFRKQDSAHYYDSTKNDYGILDVLRFNSFFNAGKAEEFLKKTQTIPFINGGLFTCHDYIFSGKNTATNEKNSKENYIIDGFSEKNNCRAKISDNVIFELINLFNDYVFTIEESTPTEQDIALDPELLGTAFENLIGFYNPETKENARKQTGSFYTPREIVDYMCRESLKESLKAKFPKLHKEIDMLIDNNEDYLNFPNKNKIIAAITDLKILDPACGSGAFPMGMFNLMVRTVEKLQERKTTYQNKLQIIENCIYGVDIQNIAIEISKLRVFISLLADYQTPENIKDFDVLPNLETKFVVANTLIGINKKKEDGEQIDAFDLSEKFQELTNIFLPFTTATTPKEKKDIKDAFDSKKEKIVNDKNFEFDKDTKDKISAWNPFNVCYCSPFFDSQIMFGISDGFDVVIGNPPYVNVKNGINSIDKKYYLETYKTATGQFDLFSLFVEMGLLIGKVLALIVPKPIINNENYEEVRKLIFSSGLKSVTIGSGIFEAAGVESCIFISSKTKNNNFVVCDFVDKLIIYKHKTDIEFSRRSPFTMFCTEINDSNIPIFNKLSHGVISLSDVVEIIRGIEAGKSDVSITNSKNKYKLLRGEDMNKYTCNYKRLYINFDTRNKTKFKPINLYFSNKMLIRRVANELIATYDTENYVVLNSIYCCLSNSNDLDLKYIVALINSKLISYWFVNLFVLTDKLFPYVRKSQLDVIPIKKISITAQRPIIAIVDKILSAKKENPLADTSALERKIDTLVYELYGLTESEIKIIEGGK